MSNREEDLNRSFRILVSDIADDLAENVKDSTLLSIAANNDIIRVIFSSQEFWLKRIRHMSPDISRLYDSLLNPVQPSEYYKILLNLGGLHKNIIYPPKDDGKGYFFIRQLDQDPYPILVFTDPQDSTKTMYSLVPDVYIYEHLPNRYRKVKFPRDLNSYDMFKLILKEQPVEFISREDIGRYTKQMLDDGYVQINYNLNKIGEKMIADGTAHAVHAIVTKQNTS